MLMLARSSVRSAAGAELDLTLVEVVLEFLPFSWGDLTVLVGGTDGAAAGEEGGVVLDDVLIEHG
jgi:hypothetical protein